MILVEQQVNCASVDAQSFNVVHPVNADPLLPTRKPVSDILMIATSVLYSHTLNLHMPSVNFILKEIKQACNAVVSKA